MKIIDVSIFCNEYEKELALLKLRLESPVVEEFIWCENTYDYRGKYKGPILAAMIEGDKRFSPFKDKITVVTMDTDFTGGRPLSGIDPKEFHNAEVSLRECATEYVLNSFADEDRIFVSDIDEMIDFTDTSRRGYVLDTLKYYGLNPIQFERIRYINDFDIRAYRSPMDIITPAFSVLNLRQRHAKLSDKKWVGYPVPAGQNPAIFEYCFCFPYKDILAKYNTSLHTCWSKGKIDHSLEYNYWTKTDYQGGPDTNNRWDWFRKVELHQYNSPLYVREHLEVLRTCNVPQDYQQKRLATYGFTEHPANV